MSSFMNDKKYTRFDVVYFCLLTVVVTLITRGFCVYLYNHLTFTP